MASITFTFNEKDIIIQCQSSDIMSEICQKFANKIQFDNNKLIFLYGGNIINKELKFDEQASSMDKERKKMNVLVYELQKYNTMDKSKIQENYFEKELKDQIYFILAKYLDDREYLENKVDNWRDAILQEVEQIFLKYKDYKTFINIIISRENKESDFYRTWNSFSYDKRFTINFNSNIIKAKVFIHIYKRNIKRKKKNIKNEFNEIEKSFLNLAEGRKFDIFCEKYYKIFKDKFDDILKGKKKNLCFLYELGNKFYKASMGFIIVNKSEDDYFLNKVIQTEEFSFYYVLGNVQ